MNRRQYLYGKMLLYSFCEITQPRRDTDLHINHGETFNRHAPSANSYHFLSVRDNSFKARHDTYTQGPLGSNRYLPMPSEEEIEEVSAKFIMIAYFVHRAALVGGHTRSEWCSYLSRPRTLRFAL